MADIGFHDNWAGHATSRAMSSPELLCLILENVDQRTLVASAQRVCKAWQHQILYAPNLQRRLFWHIPSPRTADRESEVTGQSTAKKNTTMNPLLRESFPTWFNLDNNESSATIGGYVQEDLTELMPMEARKPNRPQQVTGVRENTGLYRSLIATGIYKAADQPDNPFLRKDSSWMEMHVSDPPVTKIVLNHEHLVRVRRNKSSVTLQYPQGLRMVEFYLLVLASCTRLGRRIYSFNALWPVGGMTPDGNHLQLNISSFSKCTGGRPDEAEDIRNCCGLDSLMMEYGDDDNMNLLKDLLRED